MSKRTVATMALMAVTIAGLGFVACVVAAKTFAPILLAYADNHWFLPLVFGLNGLSIFTLIFYGKHRGEP